MKLKKILEESNAPGFKNRKFGDKLPTLDSIKAAYDAKQKANPTISEKKEENESGYINKNGTFDASKWMKEKSQDINEISVGQGLKDILKGTATAIEGFKMSKELAQGMMDWIKSSPYGRKYGKQIMKANIGTVLAVADAMGLERYLDSKRKKEFKTIIGAPGFKK